MNKLLLLLLFICIILKLNLISTIEISPIEKRFEVNSVSYTFNINDSFISRWYFPVTNYNLNFNCTIIESNVGIKKRECNTTFSEDVANKFITYSGRNYETCITSPIDLNKNCYTNLNVSIDPIPIITKPFIPTTKLCDGRLHGIYLMFGLQRNVEFKVKNIDGVDSKIQIFGFSSPDWEIVNLRYLYLSGCGRSVIEFGNSNKTYSFNHADPIIHYVIVGDSKLYIVGENFCEGIFKNNISVILNNQTINSIEGNDHELVVVNYKQLNLPLSSISSITVKVYDTLSNTISFNSNLNITTIENPIKLIPFNGDKLELTFYNIFKMNQNESAQLVIDSLNYTTISKSIIIDDYTLDREGYFGWYGNYRNEIYNKLKQNISFDIPPGCGIVKSNISIGNQNIIFNIQYELLNISNCIIDSNSIICYGDFSNFKDYYLNNFNNIEFKISNSIISTKSINLTTLIIPIKPDYQSGDLKICGDIVYSNIQIPIKISKLSNSIKLFNSKGISSSTNDNIITLYGENFNKQSIENDTFFICSKNQELKNACLFISHSIAICEIKQLIGPNDTICNLYVNGKLVNNDIGGSGLKINFLPPKILNVENKISLKDATSSTTNGGGGGGIITIIGEEFYNQIDNITIGGNNLCLNITYYNDTTLSCYLSTSSILIDYNNTTTILPLIICLTINGKSDCKELIIFKNDDHQSTLSSSSSSSSSSSISSITKLSIQIIIIIIIYSLFD